jgi:hypothetical protein
MYTTIHEVLKCIFLYYSFAVLLGLVAFRETSSNADSAHDLLPMPKNARIQYWVGKGDARIDYLFAQNEDRYEFWGRHMADGDDNTIRDARLEHVRSKNTSKEEILIAKHTAKFQNVVAGRNAKAESSMEKIDEVFADSHGEIESAFSDCERKIEILFADIEYTAIVKAVALDLPPSNPSNVQAAIVCFHKRDCEDVSVPVEKFERIEYLFGNDEDKADHLFAKCEKRIYELFAKNAARLEHLRNGKKDYHQYYFDKIDLASGIRLSKYDNAHARSRARLQNMWDKSYTAKFARSIEEIGNRFAEGQKETKNAFLAVDQAIESIFAKCKTVIEKLKL